MDIIKFADVANHYVGCLIKTDSLGIHTMDGFRTCKKTKKTMVLCNDTFIGYVEQIKPVLRPLSSMTDAEIKQIKTDFRTYHREDMFLPDEFLWLTKNSFDLFDLIKNNQAISIEDDLK